MKVFRVVENVINKVIGIAKRHLPKNWGKATAQSFINSALVLAHNPKGAIITVFYAAASALLNMACLIAIGVAFGFDNVAALVAAFSVAAIAVILSPTPPVSYTHLDVYKRQVLNRSSSLITSQ